MQSVEMLYIRRHKTDKPKQANHRNQRMLLKGHIIMCNAKKSNSQEKCSRLAKNHMLKMSVPLEEPSLDGVRKLAIINTSVELSLSRRLPSLANMMICYLLRNSGSTISLLMLGKQMPE